MRKVSLWLLCVVVLFTAFPLMEAVAKTESFNIDLTKINSNYGREPKGVKFQTINNSGKMNYTVHVKDILAKNKVTSKGTKLLLNKKELEKKESEALSEINNNTIAPVANVVQANDFITHMFKEWQKRLASYSGDDIEDDFIPYDTLKGIVGHVNKPKPYYYQGVTWADGDAIRGVFRTQQGIVQLNTYLKTSTGKIDDENFKVDLRFTVSVQFDKMAIAHTAYSFFYNYYSNGILKQFAVTADKTQLDSTDRETIDVSGPLTVVEDEDNLKFHLSGTMNNASPNTDYNHDDWVKHRKHPGGFNGVPVPAYLFFVYINYDRETGQLTLGREGEDPVIPVRGRVHYSDKRSASETLTNRTSYKHGEYLVAVPIVNALRFYEDAMNPQKLTRVGKLNWPDVSQALIREFDNMLDESIARILEDMNEQYETSFGRSDSQRLTKEAREKIMDILANDYKDKELMDRWHTATYSQGRIRVITGDRLLPKSAGARKEILDIAVEGWQKKDPRSQSQYDKRMKAAYEKHLTIADVVDAYFSDKKDAFFRNLFAVPYKVKRPDDIEIKITDTGINPKVKNLSEGVGMDEYENLSNKEPGQSSYGLEGKTYHAKLKITNHGDFPVTNTVLRYYVVSSQPGQGKRPIIYSSGTLGMFFGDTFYFEKEKKTVRAKNAQIDEATIGEKPAVIQDFLKPGESVELDFTWTMPDQEQNPNKDPVYLYVTSGKTINRDAAMQNKGSAVEPSWAPIFEREMLKYSPDQARGTVIAFTPNQIMSRDEEKTISHDDHTVAIKLDSVADPNEDPYQVRPEDLVGSQDFLRFATIEVETEEEVPRWITDGYWADMTRAELKYRRTHWLVE